MYANGISSTPTEKPEFKPVSAILLTQNESIDVLGSKTAGEVEFVLFRAEDEFYVTVGADHADRVLEALQSSFAKQVCAKPIALYAWPLAEALPHWDQLRMRSEVIINGQSMLYQDDSVAFLMHPTAILDVIQARHFPLDNGCAYFCGTLLMKNNSFQFGEAYKICLSDPVLNRSIEHRYSVAILKKDVSYIRI